MSTSNEKHRNTSKEDSNGMLFKKAPIPCAKCIKVPSTSRAKKFKDSSANRSVSSTLNLPSAPSSSVNRLSNINSIKAPIPSAKCNVVPSTSRAKQFKDFFARGSVSSTLNLPSAPSSSVNYMSDIYSDEAPIPSEKCNVVPSTSTAEFVKDFIARSSLSSTFNLPSAPSSSLNYMSDIYSDEAPIPSEKCNVPSTRTAEIVKDFIARNSLFSTFNLPSAPSSSVNYMSDIYSDEAPIPSEKCNVVPRTSCAEVVKDFFARRNVLSTLNLPSAPSSSENDMSDIYSDEAPIPSEQCNVVPSTSRAEQVEDFFAKRSVSSASSSSSSSENYLSDINSIEAPIPSEQCNVVPSTSRAEQVEDFFAKHSVSSASSSSENYLSDINSIEAPIPSEKCNVVPSTSRAKQFKDFFARRSNSSNLNSPSAPSSSVDRLSDINSIKATIPSKKCNVVPSTSRAKQFKEFFARRNVLSYFNLLSAPPSSVNYMSDIYSDEAPIPSEKCNVVPSTSRAELNKDIFARRSVSPTLNLPPSPSSSVNYMSDIYSDEAPIPSAKCNVVPSTSRAEQVKDFFAKRSVSSASSSSSVNYLSDINSIEDPIPSAKCNAVPSLFRTYANGGKKMPTDSAANSKFSHDKERTSSQNTFKRRKRMHKRNRKSSSSSSSSSVNYLSDINSIEAPIPSGKCNTVPSLFLTHANGVKKMPTDSAVNSKFSHDKERTSSQNTFKRRKRMRKRNRKSSSSSSENYLSDINSIEAPIPSAQCNAVPSLFRTLANGVNKMPTDSAVNSKFSHDKERTSSQNTFKRRKRMRKRNCKSSSSENYLSDINSIEAPIPSAQCNAVPSLFRTHANGVNKMPTDSTVNSKFSHDKERTSSQNTFKRRKRMRKRNPKSPCSDSFIQSLMKYLGNTGPNPLAELLNEERHLALWRVLYCIKVKNEIVTIERKKIELLEELLSYQCSRKKKNTNE